MKYPIYLVFCILVSIPIQAQNLDSFSESNSLREDTITSFVVDSIFIQEFMKCYRDDTQKLYTDEIIYIEAILKDDKFRLSALIGEHSKEIYPKLINILDCLNPEKISTSEIKMILFNTKMGMKNKVDYKRVLQEFKERYAIDKEVGEMLIKYGRSIR